MEFKNIKEEVKNGIIITSLKKGIISVLFGIFLMLISGLIIAKGLGLFEKIKNKEKVFYLLIGISWEIFGVLVLLRGIIYRIKSFFLERRKGWLGDYFWNTRFSPDINIKGKYLTAAFLTALLCMFSSFVAPSLYNEKKYDPLTFSLITLAIIAIFTVFFTASFSSDFLRQIFFWRKSKLFYATPPPYHPGDTFTGFVKLHKKIKENTEFKLILYYIEEGTKYIRYHNNTYWVKYGLIKSEKISYSVGDEIPVEFELPLNIPVNNITGGFPAKYWELHVKSISKEFPFEGVFLIPIYK